MIDITLVTNVVCGGSICSMEIEKHDKSGIFFRADF